jgi:hypothetical protein
MIAMKENTNMITCPSCAHEFPAGEALAKQTEQRLRQEFEARSAAERKAMQDRARQLDTERQQFEEQKRKENELFQDRLDKRLKEERAVLEGKLSEKLRGEQEAQMSQLKKELQEKSDKVKELYQAKAEIETIKREKDELADRLKAEAAKELNQRIATEKERLREEASSQYELKLRELEKQLDDQKKLTEEMKRKQEQGSMQLQGEVQELAIEQWLRGQFPQDDVVSVKQGARGGDCIQMVNGVIGQPQGSIYYESKRTKDFNRQWIDKLKGDMRDKGVDVGVIVTETMPKELQRMGMLEGIWICSFDEFKGLSAVLRDTVIKVNEAMGSRQNTGEKMQMLYDYLTSSSFRMQVEAIVEGFTSLKEGLAKEKIATMKLWAQREKQLEKVIENTVYMYGSVRGIAGSAVQEVKALELPETLGADE